MAPDDEIDGAMLIDAVNLDTIAIRNAGNLLEVTIGQFGPGPFAARVMVPKDLDEEGIRAFCQALSDKVEDIVAYLDAAKKELRDRNRVPVKPSIKTGLKTELPKDE